ncbi:MAG: hypothetical protein ACYDHY_15025 [Acidiferrobacterales bacterium]
MNFFDYITGITALISFSLQMASIFSEYAEAKKTITIFLSGMFTGSVAAAFFKSHPSFDVKISGFSLLVGFLLLLGTVLLIFTATVKDGTKRGEMWVATTCVFIIFLFVLFAGAVPRSRLSESELVTLGSYSEAKGNYARALNFLNQAKNGAFNSQLKTAIQARIDALKKKQADQLGLRPGLPPAP